MAKAQTFGDKVAKAQQNRAAICPVCGAVMTWVKVIDPTPGPTGGYRFRSHVEKVCKCQNADLMTK